MSELLIYGGATACFALGFFAGAATRLKAIKAAQDEADDALVAYTKTHKRMVQAAKDANALQDELDSAQASIVRLTDALAAKNARLERIYEKGIVSKSGAAVHLAKIAEGLV